MDRLRRGRPRLGPRPPAGGEGPLAGDPRGHAPTRRPAAVRVRRPMNGRDFLSSARRLAAGPDEADWRSAVSRAYYAAFHAARDLLADLRFRTPRADRAHNYLYVRLNNCGEPSTQDAA